MARKAKVLLAFFPYLKTLRNFTAPSLGLKSNFIPPRRMRPGCTWGCHITIHQKWPKRSTKAYLPRSLPTLGVSWKASTGQVRQKTSRQRCWLCGICRTSHSIDLKRYCSQHVIIHYFLKIILYFVCISLYNYIHYVYSMCVFIQTDFRAVLTNNLLDFTFHSFTSRFVHLLGSL